MNKIYYLSILGFAALYVVTVFATAFLGYLSPYAWVFFPVIAALLGAFSYYSVATRWQKFGVGTLLAFILAVFLFAVGECDLPETLLILTAGVVSDVVRQLIGYNTLKGQSIAYPIQAIGVIAWILPLWTRTEWYYQGATEELGVEYAKGLMTFASHWGLLAVVLTTAIAGFVGIKFAAFRFFTENR
jgi:putative ECF transporter S component (TIGR02185 family)